VLSEMNKTIACSVACVIQLLVVRLLPGRTQSAWQTASDFPKV
jgi:hypothetical protein